MAGTSWASAGHHEERVIRYEGRQYYSCQCSTSRTMLLFARDAGAKRKMWYVCSHRWYAIAFRLPKRAWYLIEAVFCITAFWPALLPQRGMQRLTHGERIELSSPQHPDNAEFTCTGERFRVVPLPDLSMFCGKRWD
jgi:hypothetical protein